MAFSEACHRGFSLDTMASPPPSSVKGFCQLRNESKANFSMVILMAVLSSHTSDFIVSMFVPGICFLCCV